MGLYNLFLIQKPLVSITRTAGKYCQLIGDNETRLKAATKFRCHKQAVDAHVQMRNRTGLQRYIRQLPADEHVLHEYALRQYNSTDVKWKM